MLYRWHSCGQNSFRSMDICTVVVLSPHSRNPQVLIPEALIEFIYSHLLSTGLTNPRKKMDSSQHVLYHKISFTYYFMSKTHLESLRFTERFTEMGTTKKTICKKSFTKEKMINQKTFYWQFYISNMLNLGAGIFLTVQSMSRDVAHIYPSSYAGEKSPPMTASAQSNEGVAVFKMLTDFLESHVLLVIFILRGIGLLSRVGRRCCNLRLLRRLLHLQPLLLSNLCLLLPRLHTGRHRSSNVRPWGHKVTDVYV